MIIPHRNKYQRARGCSKKISSKNVFFSKSSHFAENESHSLSLHTAAPYTNSLTIPDSELLPSYNSELYPTFKEC